ncbi:MAG TPA: thiol reductant ABC exporter subunit CydD [Gaiellaceae bacterium]|nr:thiol reductant ABC exporter subunit CydD [Gaiellaceae bacterium]
MRSLDPRLVRRARAVRVLLAVDVVVGLAATLLVLVQATAFGTVVARAFAGSSLSGVGVALAVFALAFAGRAVLAWAFELAGRHASTAVLSELRLSLAADRLRSAPSALDGVETAEVAAASVTGVDPLAAYFGRYLPQLVLACIAPVAILVWVATIDVTSALVMLATLPLVPVFMWLIGRYTEERTRERWQALRLLSTHYLDVVRGLPTLRAFNRSHAQEQAIAETSERYRKTTMGTLRIGFLSGSVLELAATMGVALVAVTVGVRLDDGGLGLQAGLVVLMLAPELYLPLRQLGASFHTSADGLAVAERMLALLDDAGEPAPPRTRTAPNPAHAALRFRGVSFTYPAREGAVLDGLELTISPRETLAVVGESGAGKSTLASLVLGLAQPTSGSLELDGIDLADCRLEDWRSLLAWVPQQPTIFRGTIAENIRLGRPDATDAEVRAAAVRSGADGFVCRLEDGYDTLVGDGGRILSAGERRRIALARALVRDAALIVLDEPTADLDPESAELVAHAIDQLRGHATILLIAHRPALAALADRTVWLSAGKAIERRARAAA